MEGIDKLLFSLSITGYGLLALSFFFGESRISNSEAYIYMQLAFLLMGMIFAGILNFKSLFENPLYDKEIYKMLKEIEKEQKLKNKK